MMVGTPFKIGVIGGGPAGSLFSIFALRLAREKDIPIQITIFDKKDFSIKGPRGCNMCAGVIQHNLISQLGVIGLSIPQEIIQSRIKGYTFFIHSLCADIRLNTNDVIYTVFRGGGPLCPPYGSKRQDKSNTGFDNYLLSKAIQAGANLINNTVERIEFSSTKDKSVSIYCSREIHRLDFLIIAVGVNAKSIKGLPKGYVPPDTWHTYQAEIPMDNNYLKERFGERIHVCFIKPRGIKYLAATPKNGFLSITAIGKSVKVSDLNKAIRNSEINHYLPADWKITCYCHPNIPVTSARHPYGDRCIFIGDAAYSRYLKNGIESAYYTAKLAAETILLKGQSPAAIRSHYIKRCIYSFMIDNIFGKIIFNIHDVIMTNKILSSSYLNLVIKEQSHGYRHKKRLSDILLHLYTGDIPYTFIFLRAFNPIILIKLSAYIITNYIRMVFKRTICISLTFWTYIR